MSVLMMQPSALELRARRLARFEAFDATKPPTTPSTAGPTTEVAAPEESTAEHDEPAAVSSASLFELGFPDADVGRALVRTRGDAPRALELLREEKNAKRTKATAETEREKVKQDDEVEADDDEEAADLERALAMSLENHDDDDDHHHHHHRHTTRPERSAAAGTSAAPAPNHLWAPPRYVPPADGSGPRLLSVVEDVEVRDGGYAWQRARAFLDTGNQALTIVDKSFAARHAIYRPELELPPSLAGGRAGAGGQAERWTTLHGVVPGASSRAPCVTVELKLRGERFVIQVAVSELGSHDLLVGADVLDRLFSSGWRIGGA